MESETCPLDEKKKKSQTQAATHYLGVATHFDRLILISIQACPIATESTERF